MRLLLLIALLLVGIEADAQQRGLVKTQGRLMGDGSVRAGRPLSEVAIFVENGNSYITDADGRFTLSVPASGEYRLTKVMKSGYRLLDPDVLRCRFKYSPNTHYIILYTPAADQSSKLEAQQRLNKALERQVEELRSEVDSLRRQNVISEERYAEVLGELERERQRGYEAVEAVAEGIAATDFDASSELERMFSVSILRGDIITADSLLRAYGDIDEDIERLDVLRGEGQCSDEEVADRVEDIAQRCYHRYQISVLTMQPDSAVYYLEQRAALDPENSRWQRDAERLRSRYEAAAEQLRNDYRSRQEQLRQRFQRR